MEKIVIQNLQQALPSILPLLQKEENLLINYDREVDVLYVSFGKIQKADDTEIVDSNLLVRKKGNKIVGVTLLNFKKNSLS